ncbi:23S rRNA pseudouridine(955/2504/2580) synthase RluC [Thiofaba sp. EF100]|uniref:23S rRNA pseudouridine(955/2504/2580) synthase RluC n=1 Tax=Thiofaba sp. EF100 TaxID=3121274 RepID=UPI00322210AA
MNTKIANTESPSTAARLVTVGEHEAGQRLDNFLLAQLKGVPKSRIYRMLRTGEVRVNKGRAKPMQRIVAGDVVRIPPLRLAEREAPALPPQRVQAMRDAVLYEDEHLLILNKPPGLAVHGGSGVPYGLIELARAAWSHLPGLELAHRLDRDTSGCLVLAKQREALLGVQRQLVEKTSRKAYLALLQGVWRGGARRIEAPLLKNELMGGERVVRVDERGKSAVSVFEPIERFDRLATLVRVTIETGRTHQIRVHAQHMGHPLAGDDKYGDEVFNRQMKGLGLARIFLHAEQLEFLHPITECTLRVSAPLPADLTVVLERLRAGAAGEGRA